MLENQKIIRRLSLEQKINLVVSSTLYENETFSYYDFPIFSLKDNFDAIAPTLLAFQDEVLRTFNVSLYEKYGFESAKKYLNATNNPFIRVNFNDFRSTEDPYLLGKYGESYLKGASLTKLNLALETSAYDNNTHLNKEIKNLPYDMLLENEEANFALVESNKELELIKKDYLFNGSFFAKASEFEEVAKLIHNQCSLIYFDGDKENLVTYLENAINGYEEAYGKLQNKQLSVLDFDKMVAKGEILNPDELDRACDTMIDILAKTMMIKDELKDQLPEDLSFLNHVEKESIVLLKNKGHILPLNREKNVAVIGDVVKNKDYYQDGSKTLFEEISNYEEIKYIGYAHGYMKNQTLDEKLIDAAKDLVKISDVTLYFIAADQDSHIPMEQIETLKALRDKTTSRIVGVIFSKEFKSFEYDELFDALIYAGELTNEKVNDVLDVLTNRYNPSGRLARSVRLLKGAENLESVLPPYANENIVKQYEFGYGLSYGRFEYSNLEIKENGVMFTIHNNSEFDGEDVPQLYIQKEGSNSTLSNVMLKGFEKVFVPKNDAVKVFIPFDEFTFRYFDEYKKCFGKEGGAYNLFICSSSKIIRLKGIVKVERSLDGRYNFENKEETFYKENLEDYTKKSNNNGSIKTHIAIASLFYIYILGSFIYLLMLSLDRGNEVAMIADGTVLGISTLIFLIYVIVNSKKLVLTKEVNINDTLTRLVDHVGDYVVTNRRVYPKAEPQEAPQEEVQEETEEVQEETKEVQEFVDPNEEEEEEELINLEESTLSEEEIKAQEEQDILLMEEQSDENKEQFENYEEIVSFDNSSSLDQVSELFAEYLKTKNVVIDLSSVRSLFSALAASHITFVTSKVKELIPTVLEALNDFFGNKYHSVDTKNTWNSSFYLVWKKEEDGTYSKTQFVNDVYNANRLKKNLNIVTLNHVEMKNLEAYFDEFIKFNESPSYVHTMKINNKQKLRIPNNLFFILLPEEDDYLENLPASLAGFTTSVELLIRKTDVESEPSEEKIEAMSYPYFLDLIYFARKDHFISEESWKKIDEFIIDFNEKEHFELGNKTVLQIERYAAIFLGLGGDETEALDSVFGEIIVPLLKNTKLYHTEHGVKEITQMLEKHFDFENLTKTLRNLQMVSKTNE